MKLIQWLIQLLVKKITKKIWCFNCEKLYRGALCQCEVDALLNGRPIKKKNKNRDV